jgi:hypothetical protein
MEHEFAKHDGGLILISMINRKKYTLKLSITEEMPKIKLSFIGASPKLEKKYWDSVI